MHLVALLLACSTTSDTIPPVAVGMVCVEAHPADAVITIAGQAATERCTTIEQTHISSVEVSVSAPGHKTHTTAVGLTGGTETVKVILEPTP